MKPHIILILLGCLTLSASAERPNILFIMTDQHFADVMSNVMGSKYVKTPNLDRLVAEGVRFDRAYAPNPLCRPARNAIFTGHYPFQTGIQSNRAAPLSKDIDCMGAMLREAGYATGYFGKWHLNIKTSDSKRHGFDEMGVLQANGADHKIPPASIEFLKRKRDKPFLLVTSFTSPHDICELCRGQKIPSGPIGENHLPRIFVVIRPVSRRGNDELTVLANLFQHAFAAVPRGISDAGDAIGHKTPYSEF